MDRLGSVASFGTLRSVEAVGTPQKKGGDLDDAAIKSYVRAGNAKKAAAAAGKLPNDHAARLDRSLLTAVSPMRTAADAAAAAAADVLDDDEALAWTMKAIDARGQYGHSDNPWCARSAGFRCPCIDVSGVA